MSRVFERKKGRMLGVHARKCWALVWESMEKELKGIHAFLEGQRRLLDSSGFAGVQDQQCRAWVARLQHSGLTPHESAALAEVIADGPWLAAQKQQLGQALAASVAARTPAARRRLQTVVGFGAYLTDSDMQFLVGNSHALHKLELLATRCVRLGIHLPSETTVRHIVACAVDCVSIQWS